jgi:hypothetical protein
MRPITIFTAASLYLLTLMPQTGSVLAQACDKCPQRQVTLYDFNVTVPRPDSLGDLGLWYMLYFAGPGAASAIFSNAGCIRFIDAAFYRDTTGVPAKSLTVGIDHPHTAPAGHMKGMDYLVTGTVSPDGSGFLLTMSLETACDRVTVVSASGHFATADQASAKGKELAQQKFSPLATIIRDFELDRRSQDTKVSIGGYNVKLVADPVRHKAAPNETVPVKLTLTDCDGEPLADREISLTGTGNSLAKPSYNGSFTTATATTGNDGSVTVDFKVGPGKKIALARVYYFHKTPFSCEAVAADEAGIAIEGTAAYYQVRLNFEESRMMEVTHFEQPTPTWTQTSQRSDTRRLFISSVGVLANSPAAVMMGLIELDGVPVDSGYVAGAYSETINLRTSDNYADDIATIQSAGFEDRTTLGGPLRSDGVGTVYFCSVDPANPNESSQWAFTTPFTLQEDIFGQGYEITTGSGHVFDTSYSVDVSNASTGGFDAGVSGMTYKTTDSMIIITGSKDTSWSSEGVHTHLVQTLNATLEPLDRKVGIRPGARTQPGYTAGGRLTILNDRALVKCRLQDIAAQEQIRVGLYTVSGRLVSDLYNNRRGTQESITIPVRRIAAGAGLYVVVLRVGTVRESGLIYCMRNRE